MPGDGRSSPLSELNDLKLRIEAQIQAKGLDAKEIKGKIGLQSGRVLAFINASTPDDPVAIDKLKRAAKDVLNITL